MRSFVPHYEDMTQKHFPHYWPFVRGNPLITEGSPSQSNVELWCFLCCYPEQAVEQTVQWPVFWGGHDVLVTSLCALPCYGSIFSFLNSLAPGRYGNNFKRAIFKLTSWICFSSSSFVIALWITPLDPIDNTSTLVQVIAQGAVRQQAITWANADIDLFCLTASLGLSELTHCGLMMLYMTLMMLTYCCETNLDTFCTYDSEREKGHHWFLCTAT